MHIHNLTLFAPVVWPLHTHTHTMQSILHTPSYIISYTHTRATIFTYLYTPLPAPSFTQMHLATWLLHTLTKVPPCKYQLLFSCLHLIITSPSVTSHPSLPLHSILLKHLIYCIEFFLCCFLTIFIISLLDSVHLCVYMHSCLSSVCVCVYMPE